MIWLVEVKAEDRWVFCTLGLSRVDALDRGRALSGDCPGIVWRVQRRLLVMRWLPVGAC